MEGIALKTITIISNLVAGSLPEMQRKVGAGRTQDPADADKLVSVRECTLSKTSTLY